MTHLELSAWWLTLLLLTVAPPLILVVRYQAKWRWLALGVASYVAAMIVKALLHRAAEGTGLHALPPWAQAATVGLISALAELGFVLPFVLPGLWRGEPLRWPGVLAFGIAIGIFEMLFTLLLGLAQIFDETGQAPSLPFFTEALGWGFLSERGITILGHASSRALLYAGLRYRSLNAVALAVALFTLNDGAASYPELAGWLWTDRLLWTMKSFFAALVIVEFACVALLARRHSDDSPRRARNSGPRQPPPADSPPAGGAAPRVALA
jgi:hypothetical protein